MDDIKLLISEAHVESNTTKVGLNGSWCNIKASFFLRKVIGQKAYLSRWNGSTFLGTVCGNWQLSTIV